MDDLGLFPSSGVVQLGLFNNLRCREGCHCHLSYTTKSLNSRSRIWKLNAKSLLPGSPTVLLRWYPLACCTKRLGIGIVVSFPTGNIRRSHPSSRQKTTLDPTGDLRPNTSLRCPPTQRI